MHNKDVALYRFQDLNVVTLRNNKENILGLFSLFTQTDLSRTSKKDAAVPCYLNTHQFTPVSFVQLNIDIIFIFSGISGDSM